MEKQQAIILLVVYHYLQMEVKLLLGQPTMMEEGLTRDMYAFFTIMILHGSNTAKI